MEYIPKSEGSKVMVSSWTEILETENGKAGNPLSHFHLEILMCLYGIRRTIRSPPSPPATKIRLFLAAAKFAVPPTPVNLPYQFKD
jgi:hypothetical protein